MLRENHPGFPDGSFLYLFCQLDDEGFGGGLAGGEQVVLSGFGGRVGPGCGDAGGDFLVDFFGGDSVTGGYLVDNGSGGCEFVHSHSYSSSE